MSGLLASAERGEGAVAAVAEATASASTSVTSATTVQRARSGAWIFPGSTNRSPVLSAGSADRRAYDRCPLPTIRVHACPPRRQGREMDDLGSRLGAGSQSVGRITGGRPRSWL